MLKKNVKKSEKQKWKKHLNKTEKLFIRSLSAIVFDMTQL